MLDSLILPPVIWVQIPPYDANCRNLIPLPTLPSKGSSAQLLNLCNNDYLGWIQNSSHLIAKCAFVVLKSLIGFMNTVYKKSFTILYNLTNTTSLSQSLCMPVKSLLSSLDFTSIENWALSIWQGKSIWTETTIGTSSFSKWQTVFQARNIFSWFLHCQPAR